MRALILDSLRAAIDPGIADDLLAAYEKVIAEYRKGDAEAALVVGGKFVEHVLRAIEFRRTSVVLSEIKSVAGTIKDIEKDMTLPESLRILVPRVAASMMFDVRSKRGAAHVKEISPQQIDAALATQAASWIVSEFVRLYHTGAERDVALAMSALMRGNIPLIERFGDERVVTASIDLDTEILLQLFSVEPVGLRRAELGACLRQQASTVSKAVKRLEAARLIHLTRTGEFRITGPGERALSDDLSRVTGSARRPSGS